jgi:hypothetical protein
MAEDPSSDEILEQQIRRILKRVESQLRKDLKPGQHTFDETEGQAIEIGDEVKKAIVEEVHRDCGSGFAGSRIQCSCGAQARYKGVQERELISCTGVHRFARAYYYCPACRHGFCPLDEALSLPKMGECSVLLRSLVARFCCYLPYRLVAQELEVICGIRLAASTIERVANQVGSRLAQEWQEREQLVCQERAPASAQHPRRLHLSMDGVMIFVGGEWREAKLGCAYQTRGRGDGGSVTRSSYSATLGNSRAFGRRMQALSHWEGADRCGRIAVVADGSPWIWQEVGKYFPLKTQILDYYHVTQHLWAVANARFGEQSQEAKLWMGQQKERLLANEIGSVITEVTQWSPRKEANRKMRKNLLAYLETHRGRMSYRTFAGEGWHIGSGVIEAGCKSVVKQRMGGAGMRWSSAGAEAMLHLCAAWRSTDRVDFAQYAN